MHGNEKPLLVWRLACQMNYATSIQVLLVFMLAASLIQKNPRKFQQRVGAYNLKFMRRQALIVRPRRVGNAAHVVAHIFYFNRGARRTKFRGAFNRVIPHWCPHTVAVTLTGGPTQHAFAKFNLKRRAQFGKAFPNLRPRTSCPFIWTRAKHRHPCFGTRAPLPSVELRNHL